MYFLSTPWCSRICLNWHHHTSIKIIGESISRLISLPTLELSKTLVDDEFSIYVFMPGKTLIYMEKCVLILTETTSWKGPQLCQFVYFHPSNCRKSATKLLSKRAPCPYHPFTLSPKKKTALNPPRFPSPFLCPSLQPPCLPLEPRKLPAQPRPVLLQGRGRLWLAQLQGLLQVVAKYFAPLATRSGSLNLCLSAASCKIAWWLPIPGSKNVQHFKKGLFGRYPSNHWSYNY